MEKWGVSLFVLYLQSTYVSNFSQKMVYQCSLYQKKAHLVFILCIAAEAQGQTLCNRLGFGFYVMPV